MQHAKSYSLIDTPYTAEDRHEDAVTAEIERIAADPVRLAEAVESFDPDDTTAIHHLLVLSRATYLLARLAEGDTVEQAARVRPDVLRDFRALIRAAADADSIVQRCVREAAEDELARRSAA